MIINKNILYKCYLRSHHSNMKLCGIYYKINNILIRILGESNFIYSINLKNNGYFNCACQYYSIENNHHICKHIFYLLFKIFKIFKKWKSSNDHIILNRTSNYKIIKYDHSFLHGKLNEISLLLLKRKIKENYFKKLDNKLYEIDNYFLRYKSKDNPIYKKYFIENSNNSKKCIICFNDKNLSFQCYQCKNLFHTNCINTWINENPTCPFCRYNLIDYKNYLTIISRNYHKLNI